MTAYLTHDLIWHLVVFQAVLLAIALDNARRLHRARGRTTAAPVPTVSILVPARNEERGIGPCVSSLLAQDYPFFEVLVLDDCSSDATGAVLEGIARHAPALKVLAGSPPPEGWSGKAWACAQLADQARGDLLYFTDADTIHRPPALRCLVTALLAERADLLTGFPRQLLGTWGERLLVPFFGWASMCFLPLGLAYRLRAPALCTAVGQVMLFRRQTYQAIGGHRAVGSVAVDDLALARAVKACGWRWRLARAADLVDCRMYRGASEAVGGFAKNLFAAFGYRLLPFLAVYAWLAIMFWAPLAVLGSALAGLGIPVDAAGLSLCLGVSLLLWLIPYVELGLGPGLALTYPLAILANLVVALHSLRLTLSRQATWKGRPVPGGQWQWL